MLFSTQINPKKIVKKGIMKLSEFSKIQQIGIDVSIKDSLVLKPGTFKCIEINESVDLPKNIYADLTIRSSFSRIGVFQSSGKYDPGFHGICGLTLYNFSDVDVKLEAGDRIAQMVFYRADSASAYNGFYNKNKTIESQYKKEQN